MIQNVVGGIGVSLKFGAKMLKDTVGKAVPISKLEKEYFALKEQLLFLKERGGVINLMR